MMMDDPLCSTARKVLETLLEQPGTEYTTDDVCERIDCTSAHTRAALEMLAQAGLVERWEAANGSATYVARK